MYTFKPSFAFMYHYFTATIYGESIKSRLVEEEEVEVDL